MQRFVGLLIFTFGMAMFAVPLAIFAGFDGRVTPEQGVGSTVGVRALGLLAMVGGFRVVVG